MPELENTVHVGKAIVENKEVVLGGVALAAGIGLIIWGGSKLHAHFMPSDAPIEVVAEVVEDAAKQAAKVK